MAIHQPVATSTLRTCLYLFFGYGILVLPFPFYVFNVPYTLSQFLFQDVLNELGNTQGIISSDSRSLYLLAVLLFVFALISALVLSRLVWWRKNKKVVLNVLHSILCYYLALQLMKYGMDKMGKAQFYLPEPNTLFSPLGKISKDLLFWSTMGTSYAYNLFMGLLEVIPALLLLSRKTRTVALVMATAVLANVVAINFSFDISVKLYSLFLLTLCLFLLAPQFGVLADFFFRQQKTELVASKPWLPFSPFWNRSIRGFVYALIFFEALFPYLRKGTFNDDLAPRPYLHGAYQVEQISSDYDIKRIFIHRNGYLIFQDAADEMQDFHLSIDTINGQFLLTDYQEQQQIIQYQYQADDSLLFLQFPQGPEGYQLRAKAVDWRSLPALRRDFHWTID